MTDTVWILLIASLVSVSCSMVGTFLVLRRMSMLGDAITHSMLFGIAVTFLLSGSRSIPLMLLGAAVVGLLTSYITDVLHRRGKLQEDASIGITFTALFAVGVILISAFAGQIDLDQDCVLYGEIALAPLDTIELFGGMSVPRAFVMIGTVTLLNLFFIFVSFRHLKAVTFDALLAQSIGINVALWHYLLMTFVSITAVASFESVGAILVVAMLVVPPNTAYLFSRSLTGMLWISAAVGIASALIGYGIAAAFDASIAASIAIAAGGIFTAAVCATYRSRTSL